MNIRLDPKLHIICKEVLREVPYCESIILCGSRAKTKTLSQYSDYDVIVVMKTCLIPIYLSKLKEVEHRLSQRLGVKVGIDPMPMFRVRYAKGNLFLLKVKREGLTIWGKDFMASLNPGDVKDISFDWYFSYLSSLMKELVQTFDPVYLYEVDKSDSNQLTKSAAKALIGCGELFFLLRGLYVEDPKVMVTKLKETNCSKEYMSTFVIDTIFLEGQSTSLNVRTNLFRNVNGALQFWLFAKSKLLEMFYVLMRHFSGSQSYDLDKLVTQYLRTTTGIAPLKNLEYAALTFLLRKEVFSRTIVSRSLVADRLRFALIWLLAAIEDGKGLRHDQLNKAYEILRGHVKVSYSNENLSLWRSIKRSVCTYWPYACTVMGI